jgi:cysteine-rich repeat protein
VEINAQIQNRGTGSAIDSGGGDGGSVFITASFGDIIVRDEINAKSGPPDGLGGDIELFARGLIDIQSSGQLIAEGGGGQSDGGDIFCDAKRDITVNGLVSALGGDSGGDIELDAGRDITITATVDSRAITAGGFGGAIAIEAGILTAGNLSVVGTVDVSAPGCDTFGFCSLGGDADLMGCDVTVEVTGSIDAQAPGSEGNGGTIFITGRNQLTIRGTVDSTGAGGPLDGMNKLIHAIGTPPVVTGTVTPTPAEEPRSVCTGGGGDPLNCLVPCPACGNGVTEFPETCDDTTGTPQSCDGCSTLCQVEPAGCDDGNACSSDSCDPSLGCRHITVPNGTPCPDGSICNGEDICVGGTCQAGTPLVCNDNNACTTDSCDPVQGCQNDPTPGSPCTDNDGCTTGDTCNSAGVCQPGPPLNCNDGNECTDDSCSQATGCVNTPRGGPCTDDGDPCTIDTCFGSCVHIPGDDGSACEDGDLCTEGDTCQAGVCQAGSPLACTALNQCHDIGVCNPATGLCSNPEKDNGIPCDDGSLCTAPDTCQDGTCTGGNPVVCSPLGQCHDVGVCSPATGLCTTPEKDDGVPCDDGVFCTEGDTCQGGTCTPGPPRDCGDGNTCTVDSCDEGSGRCAYTPEPPGTACDDGNACTVGDQCDAGTTCQPGSGTLDCNDGEECTIDSCNPGSGCVSAPRSGSCADDGNDCTFDLCSGGSCTHPNRQDGTTCDDGLFCTVNDACQAGTCTGPANDCDDGNGCTADSCDEVNDMCRQEPRTECCGDGVIENDEVCDEGPGNSDAPNASCRTDCTARRCGDGVADDAFGETCDLGGANSDTPNAGCRTDCTPGRCSDGILDDVRGEQCDDGGTDPDDGCSARCFLEPPATAELVPGKGSRTKDCIIEWKMENVLFTKKGMPSGKQLCTDGDTACDHDGVVNGQCVFHLWVCANNTDHRLPLCQPGNGADRVGVVAIAEAKKPSVRAAAKRPHEAANRQEILQAAAAVPVGNNFDVCGPRLTLTLPLKRPGVKGKTVIKLKATTSRNLRDTDSLRLFCLP